MTGPIQCITYKYLLAIRDVECEITTHAADYELPDIGESLLIIIAMQLWYEYNANKYDKNSDNN